MLFDAKTCHFMKRSTAILDSLHDRLGFRAWMVTKLCGDDLVVLNVVDKAEKTRSGDWMPWSESLCSLMVAGLGPRLAPSTAEIDVYRQALVSRNDSLAAYMGVPVRDPWGGLVGTLCGVSDEPVDPTSADHFPALESAASELAVLYKIENERQSDGRRLLATNIGCVGRDQNGLFDSAAWAILTQAEEARHRVLRNAVAFGSVKVCACYHDQAATQLANHIGHRGVATSFAKGEFGLMYVGMDSKGIAQESAALRRDLTSIGVASSVSLRAHRTVSTFACSIGAVRFGNHGSVPCDGCAA